MRNKVLALWDRVLNPIITNCANESQVVYIWLIPGADYIPDTCEYKIVYKSSNWFILILNTNGSLFAKLVLINLYVFIYFTCLYSMTPFYNHVPDDLLLVGSNLNDPTLYNEWPCI